MVAVGAVLRFRSGCWLGIGPWCGDLSGIAGHHGCELVSGYAVRDADAKSDYSLTLLVRA